MEIKRFGDPEGKKIMLLHGNLMCWRQFEDVIPLLEKEFDVYAVSFDGFDGTEKTTYTTAQDQADKLEEYLIQSCDGTLDARYAESLGCGPAVYLKASKNIQIRRMILSGQYQTAKTKTMPAWALRFMGQTEAGMQTMLDRIPDHVSLESVYATWKVGLYLYRCMPECQPDAEVACWYGQREGHMKKAIEKLRKVYPKLTVRCFSDFGHGDILNHPALLVEKLKNEMI